MRIISLAALTSAVALAACTGAPPAVVSSDGGAGGDEPGDGGGGGGGGGETTPRMVLFTKWAGYRHAAIDAAGPALAALGEERGWEITTTEDASFLTDPSVRDNAALIFYTNREVLDDAQRSALAAYIRSGHGWVGIHSASNTERYWGWYEALLGGTRFLTHWSIVETRLTIEDGAHPSTAHLGADWLRTDEWYTFTSNPRENVNVLLTIDEAHYAAAGAPAQYLMGDHPIAWYHQFEGGRAFYTALGHTPESFAEPAFMDHLAGAIAWAANLSETP